MGHGEAFRVVGVEIRAGTIGRAVERIFVFQTHGALVASTLEDGEEFGPVNGAEAG